MLCDTCQRQPNCLTHQLAVQDQGLHLMLERLQGCQQRQPQKVQARSFQKKHVQRVFQFAQKIVHILGK